MSPYSSSRSISFDLLPPEIQFELLKQVVDIKTLRALLHACPRYLEVYRKSKAAILLHVTWNHITPAVVPIAVDALEQGKHRGATTPSYGGYSHSYRTAEKSRREKHMDSRLKLRTHSSIFMKLSSISSRTLPPTALPLLRNISIPKFSLGAA